MARKRGAAIALAGQSCARAAHAASAQCAYTESLNEFPARVAFPVLIRRVRNMANPFRQPSAPLPQTAQVRREKIKIGFLAVVVTSATLLTGVLIQGCHAQRDAADAMPQNSTDALVTPTNSLPAAAATNSQVASAPPVAPSFSPPPLPAGPAATPAVASSVPPPTPPASVARVYVIKRGDTLTKVAKVNHTTIRALKAANHLTTDHIYAGQTLKLPVAAGS